MSDHVRCFQCGGGLRNWESSDIPWDEHTRWYSNCAFVRLVKGDEFVKEVFEKYPQVSPSPNSSQVRLILVKFYINHRVQVWLRTIKLQNITQNGTPQQKKIEPWEREIDPPKIAVFLLENLYFLPTTFVLLVFYFLPFFLFRIELKYLI